MRELLRDAVGRARCERRRLVERRSVIGSELIGRASLHKLDVLIYHANRVEHSKHAETVHVGCEIRLSPRWSDRRDRTEIKHDVRLNVTQCVNEATLIKQITLHDVHASRRHAITLTTNKTGHH